MTNEELKKKLCDIIAPYVSAYGDDEAIADALIAAGFRDVDDRGKIFMNGEAIVPTPDIYNKVAELLDCPLMSGVLPDEIEVAKNE